MIVGDLAGGWLLNVQFQICQYKRCLFVLWCFSYQRGVSGFDFIYEEKVALDVSDLKLQEVVIDLN